MKDYRKIRTTLSEASVVEFMVKEGGSLDFLRWNCDAGCWMKSNGEDTPWSSADELTAISYVVMSLNEFGLTAEHAGWDAKPEFREFYQSLLNYDRIRGVVELYRARSVESGSYFDEYRAELEVGNASS